MKKFYLSPEQITRLVPSDLGGCFITDRVTVDGKEIGYMYREIADRPDDSGWRFFAGDESDEYVNDLSNVGIYALNTAANHDPDIIPYLDTAAPCAFEKDRNDYRRVDT